MKQAAKEAFYIPSLDGIRAAAVALVFLAHAGLNDRVPGNFGVTAFFFLSGYLITTLLRMEFDKTGGISFKAFYLRRALRIFPPMYLVLVAASLLTLTGSIEGFLTWDAAGAQILHLSNYYIVANGWWDGRAPGTWIYWSLAVEEHFYFVFPFVYLLLRRFVPSRSHQMLILLGSCAVVLAWRLVLVYAFDAPKDRTYVATDTRIDSILFGCALAVFGNPVLDRVRGADRLWKWVLFPVGIAALLVSFVILNPQFQQTFRYTLQGLALVPIFVAAIKFHDWGPFRLLNVGPIKYIGLLSYSLYLIHPTVLFVIDQWTDWNPLVVGVVGAVTCVVLSAGIYKWVEKPAAGLRKKLSRIGSTGSQPHLTGESIAAPQYALSTEMSTRALSNPMHISAVICTRNRPDLIGNAVASVLANSYPSFDLVVVDQSDDDRTGATVRGLMASHPNLRYVHTPKPGLSRAYNIGVRETRGEILAFTDDDCIAPTDWIAQIAAAFDAEPEGDMLYGQVLLPAALNGHTGQVPTLAIAAARRFSRKDGFRIYGMGANFAARRRLFERIGGFDEILGGGGPLKSSQDFDFQYRAFVRGAIVLLRPEVKVDHYGLRTGEQWPATMRAYGVGDGAFYFKHVRCGDLFALSLLVRRLATLTLREALHAVGLRRRDSQLIYIRSCLEGIRASLGYRVDKTSRLYAGAQA